jgi:hypothetical protein
MKDLFINLNLIFNPKMEEKAVALEIKNKELEERKRQIEEELNNLNAEEYDEDIEFGGHQEEPSPYEEEFEKEE